MAEVCLCIVHFNRLIDSDLAIAELNKMGLRPAETHELLALGTEHPDLQREIPINALGSVLQDHLGDNFVPYLRRGGFGRHLSLVWLKYWWDRSYRFAAVPE